MTLHTECFLADEQRTEFAGACLARSLPARGAVVYLEGDLGAGKTTLSRGLIRALGHTGAVKSPTYTLVEPYEDFEFPLYHFDLYRLSHPEEVEFLGVEDYFKPPAVCLIEWPGRGKGYLPPADIHFYLTDEGLGRRLRWQAATATGAEIANKLNELLAVQGSNDSKDYQQ
ncbi:tRNA (adenosine(37)-N6)-threonylcarbamoyltransferase complex ATPase subunit type 1 TsaE [Gammaproteobacteria bacterium LSUCC0112]|nr:tRNA (adenosine(37)-N6)-threonylcarbamoyltransferase complex ATPase subunit type 1 TsaE [Gammaproteobacteria bacterium LSUCC0112]